MRLLVGRDGGFGYVAMWSRIVVCALAGSVTLALCLAGAGTAGAAGWSIQTTPNPTGTLDTGLSSVTCASATACTTVGFQANSNTIGAASGMTLAEQWNGAS